MSSNYIYLGTGLPQKAFDQNGVSSYFHVGEDILCTSVKHQQCNFLYQLFPAIPAGPSEII